MKRDLTVLKAIIKADYDRHVKRFDQLKPEKDIVFIGDSIVAYFPLRIFNLNARIHNLGIPGDTTDGVIQRMHQILPLKPKTILLHIGLNDEILLEQQPDQTIQSIDVIIQYFKNNLPQTKIVLISLTPINQSAFPHGEYVIDRHPSFTVDVNKGLKKFNEVTYIDLYTSLIDKQDELNVSYTTDGIHLNELGYQIYLNHLKSVL